MSKFKLLAAAAAAVLVMGAAASASAANYLYMTGSSNPWGSTSEDSAMDAAFGAGAWDKVNGFDAAKLTAGYSFIYLDGGDGISSEYNAFVTANSAGLDAFLAGGGHLMANAARWDQPNLVTPDGTGLVSGFSHTASLTAAGVLAGLDLNGAGTSWTGNFFSHDVVTGIDTCYVTGGAGCVFGSKGAGLFVGGQTSPQFQSGGGEELRVNELRLAAAIPEPASWALMIGGFGLAGAALRTRRRQALATA